MYTAPRPQHKGGHTAIVGTNFHPSASAHALKVSALSEARRVALELCAPVRVGRYKGEDKYPVRKLS